MKKCLPLAAALLSAAAPIFAASYVGGAEDRPGLDYDYNDTVFTLDGDSLALHSATGKWFSMPALGSTGVPFWNNSSLDGPNDNVGYCVYGGGSCNSGVGLKPNAYFLAADPMSKTGSANDVYFSSMDSVTVTIPIQITKAHDVLGWYLTSDPGTIYTFDMSGGTSTFMFNPGGDFGLALNVYGSGANPEYTYYSQNAYGSQDNVSHFAFFGDPASVATPEPASVGILALGLAICGIGSAKVRRGRR